MAGWWECGDKQESGIGKSWEERAREGFDDNDNDNDDGSCYGLF